MIIAVHHGRVALDKDEQTGRVAFRQGESTKPLDDVRSTDEQPDFPIRTEFKVLAKKSALAVKGAAMAMTRKAERRDEATRRG